MKKGTLTLILILAFVVIVGTGVYFIFFKDDCDPAHPGHTKKGKISDKCFGGATDPKNITAPPPAGCKSWLADSSYPLKHCMSGNRIKALQTALGFTGTAVDGKFGGDTLAAVQAKFAGRNEVTQAEYDALTASAPANTDVAPKKGDIAYARVFTNLYKTKSISSSNIFKSIVKDAKAGLVIDIDATWAKIYDSDSEGYYYANAKDLKK